MTEKELIAFLKSKLRLGIKWRGGCPEENQPADMYLQLKLDDEIIHELWIDR
jgi:hypothetical protein